MIKAIVDLGISLNGVISRQNGDEDWLPEAGWDEFLKQIDKYKNMIIGRETYELVKEKYVHDNFDEIKGVTKIIVTRNQTYHAPNEDYIVVHSPEEATFEVEKRGLEFAYVGGGGKLAGSFLKSKLVEGIHLTIYPKIIAQGRSFVGEEYFDDVDVQLLNSESRDGKLILDYKVF